MRCGRLSSRLRAQPTCAVLTFSVVSAASAIALLAQAGCGSGFEGASDASGHDAPNVDAGEDAIVTLEAGFPDAGGSDAFGEASHPRDSGSTTSCTPGAQRCADGAHVETCAGRTSNGGTYGRARPGRARGGGVYGFDDDGDKLPGSRWSRTQQLRSRRERERELLRESGSSRRHVRPNVQYGRFDDRTSSGRLA
jgi:hypothetical protein